MRIHKEGKGFLGKLLLISAVLLGTGAFLEIPDKVFLVLFITVIVVLGFFTQFFRNPVRETKDYSPGDLFSPADGEVVVLEKTFEKDYFKQEMLQLSIFMSPFNVHANRNPFNGRVIKYQYEPGKYLMAFNPKSSELNERTTMILENEGGAQILMRQIAGFLARRVICYLRDGQPIKAGTELGFIKFGSRADLFLPLNTEILVKKGDKVKGSLTKLARLPK